MFMSKVEKGLLYDGFKAVCNLSIAWWDLLLVDRPCLSLLLLFDSIRRTSLYDGHLVPVPKVSRLREN